MQPINLGIAGFMGSGKSVCARYLSRTGGTLIEADVVAKEVMNSSTEIRDQLQECFGSTVISNDGIHYAALGSIAFRSSENLSRLNAIVHPPLLDRLQEIYAETEGPVRILDAALIPLWHIEDWFDELLWIHAPKEIRVQRVLDKSSLQEAEVKNRMKLQEELFKEPQGNGWVSIVNDGTISEFETAIAENISDNLSSYIL